MCNEAAGPISAEYQKTEIIQHEGRHQTQPPYFRKAVEGESEEECIGRSSMDVLEYLGWESHKMDSGLH